MSDSIKDQFSDDEWFVISSVPSMVGAGMAGAGKSGIIGTTKEAMASMKTVVAGRTDYPDNTLINAILEKAESFGEAKEKAGAYREKALSQFKEQGIKTPEEFNTYMLDNAAKAVAMVKAKCSDKEAAEYQQWCTTVAEKVAEAASEGGFMGFGGEKVSENEKALMVELQKVFTHLS